MTGEGSFAPKPPPAGTEVLSEVCYCGRTFLQQNALSNHRRYCQTNKKRLSSVLESARDAYTKRKKARTTYDLPNMVQPEQSTVPFLSSGSAYLVPAEADIPTQVSLTHTAQDSALIIQLAE